ncbi:MAG: class I SAM-dependent methyltransferase [Actinobacteria bacterium]|nr:class I SAM-dependent methyltransferase [Actinomycetota bacterium]
MKFAFWRRRRNRASGVDAAGESRAGGVDQAGGAGGQAGSGEDRATGGEGQSGGGEGRISRTSQAVALTRARLERPHSPDGDPQAQARLCEGMRPTPIERLRPMLAARTRFFDQAVLTALAAGVRQVVICGAGYDDRALRFRTPGARFFELDQGPTQADKARRLQALGTDLSELTLATADFRRHDVAAVLAASGHDRGRPTLFLCEGLLIYLDQPTLIGLLSGLAACAAPGSRLAASLAIHAEDRNTAEVVAAANARRRAGETEPWRTILPRDEQLALLTQAGWQPERVLDAAELEDSAPPGRTLLVEAGPAAG